MIMLLFVLLPFYQVWAMFFKILVPPAKVTRLIRLIRAGLGVVLNMWLNGFAFSPEILLGGLVSGLASTGMHQVFKQFIEKKDGGI